MAVDIYLQHFTPDQIIISSDDANLILRFLFGNNLPPADQLTSEDVAFAQALFLLFRLSERHGEGVCKESRQALRIQGTGLILSRDTVGYCGL